ncbi:MAG: hypothetical protein V3T05_08995, partial [Myxococcota bacterium]
MSEVAATIGGVHLRFHPRHADVHRLLALRFGDFLCRDANASERIDVEVELDANLATPSTDETLELRELSSGALVIAGQDLRADVAADNRSAMVRGPMAPQSLD